MASGTAKKLANEESPAAASETPIPEETSKKVKKIVKPAVGPSSTPPAITGSDQVESNKLGTESVETKPEAAAPTSDQTQTEVSDDLGKYTPE